MKLHYFILPISLLMGCTTTKQSKEDVATNIEFKTGVSLDRQEKLMISKRNPETLDRINFAKDLEMDDIITLSELGISDYFIINYLKEKNSTYNLRHVDVLRLQKAGVSQQIIHKLIDSGR